MNLLLLLSALLSALTGVTGGGRMTAPAEQVAVVRSVAAIAVAPRSVVALVARASDAFAARREVAAVILFVFAEPPRYASRRRE